MSIKSDQLRLRVFAGPNGSGKSSVIEKIRAYKVKGKPIDFGIYINADEIARHLSKAPLNFNTYEVKTSNNEFRRIALQSGLIGDRFPVHVFDKCYTLRSNHIRLKDQASITPLAQIIADFLRKSLLEAGKKFSFETVFSHESKLDIMRDALNAGYKVYLYFVCTDSPDINVSRVQSRVRAGGHDVPEDKIRSRYFRSLDLLYEACQLAYQAFFFDNSEDGATSTFFGHFKLVRNRKKWDKMNRADIPIWFLRYYSAKIPNSK